MTVGTIAVGIIIIATSALLELVDKDYEMKKKAFESDEVERS